MQTPAGENAAPDWSTFTDEVRCPMCEYNLRGLTQPQCPECGFRFDWPELLDPVRRSHPYLFEHHAERNVWSFFRTLIGGVHPTSFWNSLHPAQPSHPKRIWLYAVLISLPMLLTLLVQLGVGTAAESAWRYNSWVRNGSGGWLHASKGRITPTLLALNLQRWLQNDQLSQFIVVCLLWPWLTLLALNVFQWSMRKARIRKVHVLRVVVYSSDLLLLLWPFFAMVTVIFWLNFWGTGGSPWPTRVMQRSDSFFNGSWPYATVVGIGLFSYRLVQAYRDYLRFDRALATVLCAQAIAFLAAWKLVYIMEGL